MSNKSELIEPIWFSTDKQLNSLVSAYNSASLLTKLCGGFRIESEAASLRGLFFPWMRIPLGFVSQGKLSITDTEICYHAVPFRLLGWRTKNVKNDLSFSLTRANLLSVEPFDFKSPFMSAFDMPFTRIHSSLPSPLDEFLLCVGGKFNLARIHTRSRELREALMQWHD